MELTSSTLDEVGEATPLGRKRETIQCGGVLANFILALASIVIIVGVAMFFAGMHTNGGFQYLTR